MIYVDTSVVLARVLAEPVRPNDAFWRDDLVTSRLTEYEGWVRLNAYGRAQTHGAVLAAILGHFDLVELDERACARCLAAFPRPVRTLDALHLATADFLRNNGVVLEVASYDERFLDAARAMGFPTTW